MTATAPGPAPIAGQAPRGDRPTLRRTGQDRVLFGVCGGVGRYLGIDPVLVRVAFVLLAVFGGSGVLLYLVGLVAIPREAPGEAVTAGSTDLARGSTVVLGAALVAVGSLLLAGRILPALGDLFAPLVLVSLGVVVILAARR